MEKVDRFLEAVEVRRSCYALNNKNPINDEKLLEIIRTCIKQAPSAFNSQSARVMVLLGEEHRSFWKLTKNCLSQVVPEDKFEPTRQKINAFDAAYGTLLFFEDWQAVEALQKQYPAYKDNFPVWAYQANGMLEYMIWTALSQAGVGASLQHYNPLVDQAVAEHFEVPPSWKLVAQMPFGGVYKEPEPKEYMLVEARMRVVGK